MLTARMSISHPIGFRGRCQATTSPAAPNDTQTAIWGPAVASGFCRAASDSGIIATANTSVKAARTDADAGDASQERRPPAQADSPSLAASVLTNPTLRPDRSGNVTAQHGNPSAGPQVHPTGPEAASTISRHHAGLP